MTNPFAFLQSEWPDVYESATKAAGLAYPDPRTSCFYGAGGGLSLQA
jgi:type I restriction enzyme R subunit